MQCIRFLHTADIHLDASFASLGAGSDRAAVRRQELKDTFAGIIKIAKEEKVDLLFISGDLYEADYAGRSTISFINDRLGEIGTARVVLIPGNHDPYRTNSFYHHFSWNKNVTVLSGENPYSVYEDIHTAVYGVGFKDFRQEQLFLAEVRSGKDAYFNILLAHGTVDMGFSQNAYNAMSGESLASMGMDYVALGHFHNRIEKSGGNPCIYNPGSPEPLGFDEPGEHGVFLGTLSCGSSGERLLDVRFIRTGRRFYESLEVDVTGCGNDEQAQAKISAVLQYKDVKTGLFCITLKGYVERGFKINISRVQAYFRDKLFYLKLKDETIPDYNFEDIIKEPGLRGLFAKKIFVLVNKTEDEKEKKKLMRALYYGMEALESGKVEV